MDTKPWPMPPIPEERHLANNKEKLAEFILQHTPEEIAHLVIDLNVVSEMFDSSLDFEILRIVGVEIAATNQDYAISLLETYLRDGDHKSHPFSSSVYAALIGKGLPNVEVLVWDKLLNDPDDEAFVGSFEMIRDMARDAYELFQTEEPEALAVSYTESEHIEHMLKLARVKPRYERLIKASIARRDNR